MAAQGRHRKPRGVFIAGSFPINYLSCQTCTRSPFSCQPCHQAQMTGEQTAGATGQENPCTPAGPQSSLHLTWAHYRLGTVCADNGPTARGGLVPGMGGGMGVGAEGWEGGEAAFGLPALRCQRSVFKAQVKRSDRGLARLTPAASWVLFAMHVDQGAAERPAHVRAQRGPESQGERDQHLQRTGGSEFWAGGCGKALQVLRRGPGKVGGPRSSQAVNTHLMGRWRRSCSRSALCFSPSVPPAFPPSFHVSLLSTNCVQGPREQLGTQREVGWPLLWASPVQTGRPDGWPLGSGEGSPLGGWGLCAQGSVVGGGGQVAGQGGRVSPQGTGTASGAPSPDTDRGSPLCLKAPGYNNQTL